MKDLPVCTYRIQLTPSFGFARASSLMPYFATLGVSHIYTSPYLQASPGSTHGYDVVDPQRINEELGGQEGYKIFMDALKKEGLKNLIDIVPNHMAISVAGNRWWWDVLENGPSSPYAAFFDVDWESPEGSMKNRILLPVLEDHYGTVLEKGLIQLTVKEASILVSYRDRLFPMAPRSISGILERVGKESGHSEILFLAYSLENLPLPIVTDHESTSLRHRNIRVIKERISCLFKQEPDLRAIAERVIAEINVDMDGLDEILEKQNYRLSFWLKAREDLAYRRFFDINSLVGIRVEDERVFTETHSLIIKWLNDKTVDGLRVDHPDGLRDPEEYFSRIREKTDNPWILAEKILSPGETLRRSWSIAGTTGYDFLNLAGGLFVNPSSRRRLTGIYMSFTRNRNNFDQIQMEKKMLVLEELFGSDLNRLSQMFLDICGYYRKYRDHTRKDVLEALKALVVSMDIYRTYISPGKGRVSGQDRKALRRCLRRVKVHFPHVEQNVLKLMEEIILLKKRGALESEFVARFQQLTGPVTAKGVEDTALYCYNPLICLNEVGGDPSSFGTSLETFHSDMMHRAASSPLSLLATSTHDTKRSEDARCRIALISEVPGEWKKRVTRWRQMNNRFWGDAEPDRNMEYFIYQTLTGVWPISGDRLLHYLEKVGREAKVHTSWNRVNRQYEKSLQEFAQGIISDKPFIRELEDLLETLVIPGRINSLSQTLLKLTLPGVPDIYQGCEVWNFSLVDPDNRREVDYHALLKLKEEALVLDGPPAVAWDDRGLSKMWLIIKTLELRRNRGRSFGPGSFYKPLYASGEKPSHLVCCLRGGDCLVMATRFPLKLDGSWGQTLISLPEGEWRNHFTGGVFQEGSVRVSEILGSFPVGFLYRT